MQRYPHMHLGALVFFQLLHQQHHIGFLEEKEKELIKQIIDIDILTLCSLDFK